MKETCYICGKEFRVITTEHVKEHAMTWDDFQKGKKDKVLKEQIKVAKEERAAKKIEMEQKNALLLYHWFNPMMLSSIIKNFVDHIPTKEVRLREEKPIDLSPFIDLKKASVEDVTIAEALTKIGWVVTDVKGPRGKQQPKKLYVLEKKG